MAPADGLAASSERKRMAESVRSLQKISRIYIAKFLDGSRCIQGHFLVGIYSQVMGPFDWFGLLYPLDIFSNIQASPKTANLKLNIVDYSWVCPGFYWLVDGEKWLVWRTGSKSIQADCSSWNGISNLGAFGLDVYGRTHC
tara:strand:+ start:899 stop:1321 length:423 start_codon:yes stop_codon:yes gene_type:complete